MSNLKPCPFCAGKVGIMEEGFIGSPAIACDGCKTVLGYPTLDTSEEVEKAWNRREVLKEDD